MKLPKTLHVLRQSLLAGLNRLDTSLDPSITVSKLRAHTFTYKDIVYIFHILLASFWLYIMTAPPFPYKLLLPILYAAALLVPATSQFFLPATPIFAYLLSFYSSRFIPGSVRPAISVFLLPTLESVLYGANISDILTRFTHPILDLIAWIPYGVGHFTVPFIVAAFLFLFRSPPVLHLWGKAFGYMNLFGVIMQILVPCSPPWYEVIYGLTPAHYGIKGSPGGLARIDTLLHTQMYSSAFGNSPMVFGAFPSLHSACATMEALFISHFFPKMAVFAWGYVAVLYWSTMYLTHHYLIDVVFGACLATAFFYGFLGDDLRSERDATRPPSNLHMFLPGWGLEASGRLPNTSIGRPSASSRVNKYEFYDIEDPARNGKRGGRSAFSHVSSGSARGLVFGDSARDWEGDSDGEADDLHERQQRDISMGNEGQPYRSPVLSNFVGGSSVPAYAVEGGRRDSVNGGGRKGHRHTASVASLVRSDEREGRGSRDWSPVTGSFVFSGK